MVEMWAWNKRDGLAAKLNPAGVPRIHRFSKREAS